jgi:hypothetical protein
MDGAVGSLAVFGIFVMPVLGWVVVRYLAHRERMELIRHGMAPTVKMRGRDWRPADVPRPGTAMPGGADPNGKRKSCDPDYSAAGQRIVLHKGIRLTFIGLALTIGLSFIGYHDDGGLWPSIRPGPWLLGGLIPTFIGLAQVLSAVLAGATLADGSGWRPPEPPFAEPPFTPPPSYGSAPTYDSSYTYRPGGTQELRPPSPPPERR